MRVSLREATANDTPDIVRWRNEERVMRNFFYRTPFTEEGHEAWRKTHILTGDAIQFIICVDAREEEAGGSTLRAIGTCNLQHITKDTAEYGYLIGEGDMAGKGYGTEATRLTMRYAKEALGLKTLTARVMADNEASLRSFEKAGFAVVKKTKETLHPSGEQVDAVVLQVTL